MEKQPAVPVLGWILLPVVVILALGLAPRPVVAQESFSLANEAVQNHWPALETRTLAVILEIFPERGDLWEMAGMSALAAGQSPTALLDLSRAKALGGLNLDGQIALGDAYHLNGDVANARVSWEEGLRLFGPDEEIYSRLTRSYVDQLDYSNAIQVYEAWVGWQPQNAGALYQMGLLLTTRHPQEALPILLKAAKLDVSLSPSVKKIQERINAASGLTDPAAEYLQAGRALGERGEWRLASEALNQAVKTSPSLAEAWAFLGEAKQELGENGKPDLDRAMALNSNSVLVMALEALYLERQGQAASALVYLHAIADKEPDNGIWQMELGHALVQMGDLENALVYYQNAVQVEPDNPTLWRALASFCLVYNDQLDSLGLPAARKAVVLAPNDAQSLDLLGQILVEQGDYYSADRFFWRALQNNPDNGAIYLHRGVMYLDQGDTEMAYQSLHRAVDLAGTQPEGQQAQRLLAKYFP
jgi:tetratricopeptide (TPR) repeat protein